MIDIDSPPLQKKRYTIFIPREIEDKAYAQFRGGGGGGGVGGCEQVLLWEMCKNTFFHQHCPQMKPVKIALGFKLI